MSEFSDILTRMRAQYPPVMSPIGTETDRNELALASATATPLAEGVLLEVAGRTLLAARARPFSVQELPAETADAWTKLAAANKHMTWVGGRYVEAEQANRNGALWRTGDLEFGALGVRGGPVNWLHDRRRVVGTLADAVIVARSTPEEAAATDSPVSNPYIATTAALWPWVAPNEVKMFTEVAASGKAYQSMECVGESVECGSCGSQFPFMQTVARPETVCEHVRERSATRRFVNPSFLGAGLIVAPVAPGWASAHVSLMPTAARLAEAASAGAPAEITTSDFELLVASVLDSL